MSVNFKDFSSKSLISKFCWWFGFNIIFECSWKWGPCICLYFHRCQTDARIQSNYFWNQLEFFTWLEFKHLLLAISETEKKNPKIIKNVVPGHQNFLCCLSSSRNRFTCKLLYFPKGHQSSRDNNLAISFYPKSGSIPHQRLAGTTKREVQIRIQSPHTILNLQ